MRYCRFILDEQPEYGVVTSVNGKDSITHIFLVPPDQKRAGEPFRSRKIDPIALDQVRLLAPVTPSKIVCVGRNYLAHAAEMGKEVPKEPLLFFKPPSSLIGPGDTICRPKASQHTDYEGELGVIISRRCHHLADDEDVRPYILGYTVVNDFTARDLQRKDSQWVRGKGYDTFCPVGPLVTDEIDPWKGVRVTTKVNGAIRQDGTTADFIFSLDTLIRYTANIMTLLPGDLIATGTPDGVGPVVAGDVVEVEVEGIGKLSNPIVDDPS
jgi:2-keto-4-pentenoate hydratase/2-oxohepta-3-ene-1,7-dioic acid hydratase in catechol pathway